MRRLFLKLILAALVVIGGTITASATQTTITAQTVGPVFSPQLQSGSPVVTMRVYASLPFLSNDTPPVAIPSGTPQGGGQAIAPVTCTYNSTTGLISIPSFVLYNTTDALGPPNGIQATYSFYIYVNGSLLNPNPLGFLNRIGVPPIIAPHMACSPANHCADFVDLLNYNQGTPLPSIPTATYSQGVIDQKIQAAISNGGAPAGETFFVATPDVAHIPQAIPFSALGTGLVKNTTITGIPTIAVPGVDFQAPISAVTPLTFAGNAVGLAGLTTLGTSNQLVGMNNAASGYEYKTFSLGGAGSSPAVAFAPNSITLNVPTASGSNTGFLASADWTTFNNKQAALSFPLTGTQGGTGVNNGSFLFTMGGNVTFAGAFNTTITVTGGTGVTLPITGTLLANSRQIINGTGITGGGDLSADRTLSVVADTVTERIDVQQGGSVVGTRKAVNFIQGSNTTLTVTDNPGSNRVDVTVAASGVLGVSWSGLTNPSTGLSLSMGTNATSFLWVSGTTGPEWSLQHAALSGSPNVVQSAEFDTSGNTNTGPMRRINTVSGSTVAIPFQVCAQGVVNCTHVDTGGIWRADGSGGFDATALVTGTVPLGRISGLTGAQMSTSATPQFAGLGLGQAAPATTVLGVTGATITTAAALTPASAQFGGVQNSNDSATKEFIDVLIQPTLNPQAGNLNKSFDALAINIIESATTGITPRLFVKGYLNSSPSSAKWTVDDGGNEVLAGNLTAVNGSFSGPVTVLTLNGLTVSTSTGTLTVTNGKTVSFANSIALAAGADGQTFTFPSSTDAIVGRASTDTLTNKTLTSTTDTVGTVTMALGSDATGDIYYRDAGGHLARLGIGGAGTFIGNSGGVPVWATPTGSGTVNSGTSGNLSYYASSTAAVSTAPGTTFNATNQSLAIAGAASISGGANLMTWTPGAHTAVVGEVNDLLVAAHTMTVTSGYATQRFTLFAQPTVSSATSQTITNAATLAIAGAPIATGAGPAALTNAMALWVQAGNVWLQSGRTLGGGATFAGTSNWLETLRTASVSASQFAFLSTIGHIAVTGGSRSSDLGGSGNGPIGVSGWANNDVASGTGFAAGVYGFYGESHMQNGTLASTSSTSITAEFDSINWKTVFSGSVNSYGMIPNNLTVGLWLACGGGGSYAPIIQSHLALGIVNNNKSWDKGIVFGNTALSRSGDATGGTGTTLATAIELAQGHQIVWDDSTSTAGSQVVRGSLTSDLFTMNGSGKIVGGTAAGSTLTLAGTSNGSPSSAFILMNPLSSGSGMSPVGIGATATSVAGGSGFTGAGTVLALQNNDSLNTNLVMRSFGGTPGIIMFGAVGSSAIPSAVTAGTFLSQIQMGGYDGSSLAAGFQLLGIASENWAAGTNRGAYFQIATVTAGTTSLTTRARIADVTSFYLGSVVTAAATIVPTGNIFHVTGATTITSISTNMPGSVAILSGATIVLIIDTGLTINNAGTIKLKGATNVALAANDNITFVFDGTNWWETARTRAAGY